MIRDMCGNPGGGGGTCPPTIWKVGTVISNYPPPPPPHCFGVPKEDLFSSSSFFLFACLLVRDVGDVRGYPYPVSGKLTQHF